jgi:hypothetical protein
LYGATDRLTKAQIRISIKTKEHVAVADSLRWKLGDHLARMDQRRWTHAASVWDFRIGERGTGRPKILWADTFWRGAGGQWSRTDKISENGAHSHNICKSTSVGTAHLVIKLSTSLWFHQKAVRFMGIIWIVCSFI